MKLLKLLLAITGLLFAPVGFADTLGDAYKLYASEDAALKAIAGTQKHVLLFFSDSHQ